MLGYSVALPAYGATSDAFGRKTPILVAYCLFRCGCVISATAVSLQQIIVRRVVASQGGAGMTAMVAIIITDMAPLSQVALLRSYVNVAAIAGRSAGGPIGGLLLDSIGWRLSFLAQVPAVIECLVFAASQSLPNAEEISNTGKKKRELDFAGLVAFGFTTSSFPLLVDVVSREARPNRKVMAIFAVLCIFPAVAFVLIEIYWAKQPLISPPLIKQGEVTGIVSFSCS